MKRGLRVALSVACGCAAFAVASLGMSSVRAEGEAERAAMLAEYGGEQVEVCVAVRDIAPGETITARDVEARSWSSALLPSGAVTSVEGAEGRRATSAIPAQAVVAEAYFAEDEDALEVPAGTVAVSVPSQNTAAIGGALKRGDRVDVYVSTSGIAELLLSDAPVIDLSTDSAAGEGALDWVTVAVEPERVVDVLSASAQGSISLTLPGKSVHGTGEEMR